MKSWQIYLSCLGIAVLFYTFFGQNSFLMPFNSSVDLNWYLTVGHGVLDGKVVYRDLFEQKGPLVYLVAAFCDLFGNPYLVVWGLEIICYSLFLWFGYQICRKWLTNVQSLLVLPILSLIIFASKTNGYTGGAIEEYTLPILAYLLLCFLEFILEDKDFNRWRSFFLGLGLSVIIWTKFTIICFAVVPLLSWLIINLIRRRWRTTMFNLLWMLLGFAVLTVPCLLYFAVNHALYDLFHVYFYLNFIVYGGKSTLRDNMVRVIGVGWWGMAIGLLGVTLIMYKYRLQKQTWLLLVAFIVDYALLFANGWHAYYFVRLFPYCILGVALTLHYLLMITPRFNLSNALKVLAVIGVTGLCFLSCLSSSITFREISRSADEYAPVVFARTIQEYERINDCTASLFCYGIVDYGFYNAAGKVPPTKYFVRNNFDYDKLPEMYQSFEATIRSQTMDFVITGFDVWQDENEFLSTYYELYAEPFAYKRCDPLYMVRDFVLLHRKAN